MALSPYREEPTKFPSQYILLLFCPRNACESGICIVHFPSIDYTHVSEANKQNQLQEQCFPIGAANSSLSKRKWPFFNQNENFGSIIERFVQIIVASSMQRLVKTSYFILLGIRLNKFFFPLKFCMKTFFILFIRSIERRRFFILMSYFNIAIEKRFFIIFWLKWIFLAFFR